MNDYSMHLMLIVVIILQFITIFLVSGSKGQKHELKKIKRPIASGGEIKNDRKDNDQRRGGVVNQRKTHEHRGGNKPTSPSLQGRPQQNQPTATSIDPMEKSLRDINLRLKNAEKEQENARKKLQDPSQIQNGSRDGRPPQRPPVPSQRSGNNGGRDDRPPRRDFNRDRDGRKDNQSRSEFDGPKFEGSHTPSQDGAQKFDRQPRINAQGPDMKPDNMGDSDMQHGRRFTAKRRQLPDNNAYPNDTQPETNAPIPQDNENQPFDDGRSNGADTPIFGRR